MLIHNEQHFKHQTTNPTENIACSVKPKLRIQSPHAKLHLKQDIGTHKFTARPTSTTDLTGWTTHPSMQKALTGHRGGLRQERLLQKERRGATARKTSDPMMHFNIC